MANKVTKATAVDPHEFIAAVEHPTRRADAEILAEMMERITGCKPKMWGPTIVGFDSYTYSYESGREGESLLTGFSPRKANLVLYVMPGYDDVGDQLAELGKHKLGKSCLYVNKLADVDLGVLEDIVADGVTKMRATHPTAGE